MAVVHWCLHVETQPCGSVVSAVITFCLRFGRHGSINWTAWSSRDMCVNWIKPRVSRIQLYEQPSAFESELVDANQVCQGIQKVRVEPATRSAVATCYKKKIKNKKRQNTAVWPLCHLCKLRGWPDSSYPPSYPPTYFRSFIRGHQLKNFA